MRGTMQFLVPSRPAQQMLSQARWGTPGQRSGPELLLTAPRSALSRAPRPPQGSTGGLSQQGTQTPGKELPGSACTDRPKPPPPPVSQGTVGRALRSSPAFTPFPEGSGCLRARHAASVTACADVSHAAPGNHGMLRAAPLWGGRWPSPTPASLLRWPQSCAARREARGTARHRSHASPAGRSPVRRRARPPQHPAAAAVGGRRSPCRPGAPRCGCSCERDSGQ